MNCMGHARALRASGLSFARIRDRLGISLGHAYKIAGDVDREPPQETTRSVVRYGAHHGGCSTQSGMQPVSVARIPSIDGRAA